MRLPVRSWFLLLLPVVPALRSKYERDGFVKVRNVLSKRECEEIRTAFAALFSGDFDSGVYPDEWHWRQGISREDAVREIVNSWKSSDVVARVALSERIGKLVCDLVGWDGATRRPS
mmetsp:Transcript_28867/g.93047  ORF Transcript_28867/g.93047 Transcript_28867/m.93047 type:complete len:117 (+) Transcript_28867:11-361(+)